MTRRTTLTCLALLAAVAFAARLGVAVHLRAWRAPAVVENKNIAASLAGGKGFRYADWNYYGPSSAQAPPFPLLLAGLFKTFGAVSVNDKGEVAVADGPARHAYVAVMVLNAVAGAGLVWLTYGAARAVGASPVAATGAGALVAVWPTQVYAALLVQAVVLVACGLMAMVVLYQRAVRTGRAGAWSAYAFVGALVALTEPVFLPALLLSGALVLLARPLTIAQRWRNVAILAFAIVAVVGPWVARNAIVGRDRSNDSLVRHVTFVKGSFWSSVWSGNNDFATGTDRLRRSARPGNHVEARDKEGSSRQVDVLDISKKNWLSNRPESFREAVFRTWALQWIKDHRARYAQLCAIRLAKTLTVDWDNPSLLSKPYLAMRGALGLMTLAGLWVAWRQRWSALLPLLLAGSALLAYTLTMTTARYGLPFEPMQLVLGAAAATGLLPRRRMSAPIPQVPGPMVPQADRRFAPALSVGR